ncbi:sensor domain-containing protein [Frankia sp. CNm7]|uniref:histidine kinase n=2 Tax=Frankia nepalensis TaxID=1836974 RepID=A0A937RKX2_9ACTN|nr:sensor domain-containing protein [Frankia nepalensis]MBL7498259.1 sensor domain-containing protein [Frankia nepalensis]MBL7509555.1 sensor domain-containing protein [Frankia nepalensis]MBL7518976.1 sensor domain-containing protein [Frankia nepalensis]MBL7632187.1 sensor domain-containing protein [Frankia nepalensis]
MGSSGGAWAAVRGRPWRFLFSRWPWLSLVYLASSVPVGLGCLVVLALVVGLGVLTAVVVVGLLLLAGVPLFTAVIAAMERARLRLVLPREAAGPRATTRAATRATTWERLRAGRRVPASWSEIGYSVLLASVLWLVDATVLLFAVAVPVVLLLAPVLVRDDRVEVSGWSIDSPGEAWFAAAGPGLVSLVVAAYVVTALACGQAALTRLLLDPPEARLTAAVAELRRSRAGLVGAFEAERRRIERDLHDGVQQRLVGLTMTLGQAELEAPDGPALDLVRAAHAQAEGALDDLRAAIRGIHPRVLSDHGLVAAIHEIADRSPVPVDADLLLPSRLPAPVEAAAYFVVSEALTNIARHAHARSARIHAWTFGDRLVLTVVDDGAGGADPAAGSGLAGLALRVEALDGTLSVASPAGGPTEVRMECPIGTDP